MKKKLMIIAFGLCLCGALFFVGGFAALGFSKERLDLGEPLVEKKAQFAVAEIENISLSDSNFRIIVQPSNDEMLHFTYYENEDYTFSIHEGSNKITIKEKYHFNFWKNFTYMFSDMALASHPVILEIPRSYLNNLEIHTVNGGVTVQGLGQLSLLTIDSINGDIKTEDITATRYDISSVNGDSHLIDSKGEEFKYHTVNGSLHLGSALFETYSFDTVNGSIFGTLYGNQDEYSISIDKVNGSINLPSQKVIGSSKNIKIFSVNGNTNLDFIS